MVRLGAKVHSFGLGTDSLCIDPHQSWLAGTRFAEMSSIIGSMRRLKSQMRCHAFLKTRVTGVYWDVRSRYGIGNYPKPKYSID